MPTKPRTSTRPDDAAAAERLALGLLARREHSRLELCRKLAQRGFASDVVSAVADRLAQDGSLSEQRFAQAYAYSCAERGYGPLYIQAQLAARGVDDDCARSALLELVEQWPERLAGLIRRRFGRLDDDGRGSLAQRRFLYGRGFPLELIRLAHSVDDGER